MRKIAKMIVSTTFMFSFLNIIQTPVAEAKFHFRGGNVHDSSRYKQVVEWVKKEQDKLEQIKAKLQHSIDTVKQAQQAMNSVKSSLNTAMKSVDALRSNINSVMKMSDSLIHLDFDHPDKGWSEIEYSKEAIHYQTDYMNKKIQNNNIISKAIADANNSVIQSLQKLGKNTKGLLDIQEVNNEIDATRTDTTLQTTKTRASELNKELQEKIIQAENEAAANKRRAADFQVTSDPEQRTEKEITDLKRMDADSKPGRGCVEF